MAGFGQNGGLFANVFIKQDPDGHTLPDKVIQFKLALQRHQKEIINVNDDGLPLLYPAVEKDVELVTLSDDEPVEDGHEDETDEEQEGESWNNATMEIITDTGHSAGAAGGNRIPIKTQPSHMEEDDVDYEEAMNALEVQMTEDEMNLSGDGIASPRRSLPYTEEEKRQALIGNPNYDYRTRLDERGEEKYAIYKCSKCPSGFPRMHHYLVHFRSHDRTVGNNRYKCSECGLMTGNSLSLASHMERHQLQTEPELFDSAVGRMHSAPAEKRPHGDPSPTSGSKRANIQVRQAPTPMKVRPSASPSGKGTPEVSNGNGSPKVANGLSAERDEARKGNPNFMYRSGIRTLPDGRMYERTTYKCQDCPYSHEKFEVYLNHVEGHRLRHPFQCGQCSYSSSSQVGLDRHAGLHRSQDQLPQSPEKRKLKTDVSLNETSRADFTMTPVATNGHKAGPGRPARKSSTGGSERANMQCPKCPSKLSGALNLRIHLNQHGKVGMKLNCPNCDYASNREDYMRTHIRAHVDATDVEDEEREEFTKRGSAIPTAIPPHTLSEEEYSKMITGNPRFDYMTVSPSGKPLPLEFSFKCWDCPYATLKYPLLVTHQERHDANAKYGCNKCSYSANTIHALKNHKLAHTVEHAAVQIGAVINRELMGTPQGESSHSSTSGNTSGGKSSAGHFFISHIRITNIMAMYAEPTVADVSTHGILKLKGNSEEGKSSYILAVMLGLGYDLCLDHRDATTSICGLNLKNAISYGKDFASVEVTVSLRSFPELQREFGSHIKFARRLSRAPMDLSNVVVVTSADPRPQYKATHPKVLGGKDLACFLRKLKLSPERFRLMLLDGENVKYMMDNPGLWYHLFEAAVKESTVEMVQKRTESKFLLQRLHGREKLQRERLEWFQSRLELRPPLDSEKIRQVSEEDWTNHRNCISEMNQLANERKDLEQRLHNIMEQSQGGTAWYLRRMRDSFEHFLEPMNFKGELIVDESKREFGICIWKISTKEARPTTLDGVTTLWKSLSIGKRRIAIIGLYMALWEISNYLGLFAADAFSCTETDFHIPPAGLPVLWELINRKCVENKQCIISLPPEY